MLKPKKMQYDKSGAKVVENLKARHFDAYYFSEREDAIKKVLELIGPEDVVSWGGTMTVDELGIKQRLEERKQPMVDRDTASTPEERRELMIKALTSDVFLMSSNAISEDGQLVNIDGSGNRVAALCYGPRNVIVVVGMNKVVPTLEDAYIRARHIAAPINRQRFGGPDTPCMINGQCGDCKGEGCICGQVVNTRVSRPNGRIKVVLIGEDLGF